MKKIIFLVAVVGMMIVMRGVPSAAEENSGEAYYDVGVFAFEDGDYAAAEANLKKAIEMDPENAFFHHYLGKTYMEMKRYPEAERCLSRAGCIDPEIEGLAYDTAFLHYQMEDYGHAADFFSGIVKQAPDNVMAYYYAGISYFKLKRYERSLSYVLAAAEKSPSVKVNAYYYAGICFMETGRIQQAYEKFDYVRNHSDSELIRKNASAWIDALERRNKSGKPYRLYAKLGYRYDDNVQLEPVDEDMYANEGDQAFVLYLSGQYKLLNKSDWYAGVGYSHYQSCYDDLSDYDLTGSIATVFARYRLNPVTLGLSYIPSYYWLDSESYLMRHEFNPELIWSVNRCLMTRLSFSFFMNDYFQNDGKDGNACEMNLSVYCNMLDDRALLTAGGGYEDNFPESDDEDYMQYHLRLGVTFILPWDMELGLSAKYYKKQYEHVNSLMGIKRDDSKYYGAASVSRKLFYDWLKLTAQYDYTRNDSNVDEYTYERRTATVSVSASF